MRRVLPALIAVACAFAPLAHAEAAKPSFGLRAAGNPTAGYFVFPASAGTTQHGVVIVSNTGKGTGTVDLTVAEASTGSTTGTIYLTSNKANGSAAWVKLGKTELTLQPQSAERIPFTVVVPAGAAPGQYVAGIVAADKSQPSAGKSSGKTSVQIKIRNLAIMAVQVNVPGPVVHRFTIGKVTAGGSRGFQQVLFGIANQGNVLEHPKGSVTIRNDAGAVVETLPYQMDTFLPHTSINYPVTLKKALPAGNYTAAVTIAYGGGKTTIAKPAFEVTKENVQQVFTSSSPTQAPPTSASGSTGKKSSNNVLWIVIAAAVVLLVIAAALFLLFRRRRTPAAPVPAAPAAAAPAPAAAPATCDPYHHWVVDYESGVVGADGITRYPHRCRDCGLQVVAKDISEATDFAGAIKRS